jgi:hypothetical protein
MYYIITDISLSYHCVVVISVKQKKKKKRNQCFGAPFCLQGNNLFFRLMFQYRLRTETAKIFRNSMMKSKTHRGKLVVLAALVFSINQGVSFHVYAAHCHCYCEHE